LPLAAFALGNEGLRNPQSLRDGLLCQLRIAPSLGEKLAKFFVGYRVKRAGHSRTVNPEIEYPEVG
jgi:hypothetical protein